MYLIPKQIVTSYFMANFRSGKVLKVFYGLLLEEQEQQIQSLIFGATEKGNNRSLTFLPTLKTK